MPSQGNLLTIPPGPPPILFAGNIENVIDITKVYVNRVGTVTSLGGWISGDPTGVNVSQPGRFVLYDDDGVPGAASRPLNLICRSIEGIVNGANPQFRCIALPVDGVPPTIQPGIYWVGVHTGTVAGSGEWSVHGINY